MLMFCHPSSVARPRDYYNSNGFVAALLPHEQNRSGFLSDSNINLMRHRGWKQNALFRGGGGRYVIVRQKHRGRTIRVAPAGSINPYSRSTLALRPLFFLLSAPDAVRGDNENIPLISASIFDWILTGIIGGALKKEKRTRATITEGRTGDAGATVAVGIGYY